MVGGFIDVLARMRAGRIEQAELDSARARALKAYDTPELGAALLPSYALGLLQGREPESPADLRRELTAVTVDDLREVAREVWSTGLLQVPRRGADWAGFTLAPHYAEHALNGTRHRSLEDADVTLVIGEEGVSLTAPGGPVTVRYDACAAMTTRPDGARVLTGLDGFSVTVEPTLYQGVTPERIAVMDAAVPAAARVGLPARDPEHIPGPPARKPSPAKAAARLNGRGNAWAATVRSWPVPLILIIALDVVFGVGMLISVVHHPLTLGRAVLPTIALVYATRRVYARHRHRNG
ncbi:hypothetical protein ACGFS9_16895 [Streptomyces sp. NPDC048566]|uniref:hypothetical protein n=1 Tax=Streptomyces sp. NPDC048566 TaxID=3365569 RepID=UPI00371C7F49